MSLCSICLPDETGMSLRSICNFAYLLIGPLGQSKLSQFSQLSCHSDEGGICHSGTGNQSLGQIPHCVRNDTVIIKVDNFYLSSPPLRLQNFASVQFFLFPNVIGPSGSPISKKLGQHSRICTNSSSEILRVYRLSNSSCKLEKGCCSADGDKPD